MISEFVDSLEEDAPDPGLSNALQALWHEANGNWDRAHALVQDNSPESCWVHAYLHRKEGDLSNARYWYNRAGQPVARGELNEEWRAIADTLIEAGDRIGPAGRG
ncbi:MAG: hypothetical protein HUJ31_12605 [Pseudomonadales bacterium]|nr:hypothetical protein [Pseudomonadales bacterium]